MILGYQWLATLGKILHELEGDDDTVYLRGYLGAFIGGPVLVQDPSFSVVYGSNYSS